MKRVWYSRLTRDDLLKIWVQIATRNPQAADRIYDRIEERCRSLADHPHLAVARPEIGEGARGLVIERWLALYRLVEDGVQVLRIVDGARDLTRLTWPLDEGET